MTAYDFDLFTIGAGSGGVRASRIAAGHGAKVAVAEEYRVGGTCVIRGCVPKKLIVYASRYGFDLEDSAGFGWDARGTHDWPRMRGAIASEVTRLEGLYRKGLDGAKAELIEDRAILEGPHTIRLVKSGRTVIARNILIATGAAPHLPDNVPGTEHALVSNDIFLLPERPGRIVIAGAGYIALEFAAMFAGLGSEVTIVHYAPEILRGFDRECAAHLHTEMAKRGVRFVMDTSIVGIRREGEAREVGLSNGAMIEADAVLFATGRWPNTRGLGLENAGIETDAKGAIPVDAFSRTRVPGIFAVGDVTNRANLTPVAIREGHAVADTLFGGKAVAVDHADIPTAIFTTPEFGSVGLTEEAARKSHEIDIYRAKFRPMRATISGRDEQVLMKLIVDARTDRVLGLHMVGADAGEIVQMAGIAIKMKAAKADFDATLALHPSAAEEFVLMRTRS
jgi:glutathione reductase (NADPH)